MSASWHSTHVIFTSDADYEYHLDIRYETDADSLCDWYIEYVEVCDENSNFLFFLSKEDLDSGRYLLPYIFKKYRPRIEALILESMPIPSPRKESRHVI